MTEDDVSEILPIEDVLEWGTPVQRRSLLLSVLHTGADPFVRPLRVAGVNDDTEVVHYAVTALVELRSSFAQRIAAMEKRLRERPGDMGTLLASADLDEEYLQSGIPEDTERAELLAHCRGTLEKILQNLAWQETAASGLSPDVSRAGNRRGVSPDTPGRFSAAVRKSSVLRRLGRIYLQQKDAAAAERIGRLLIDASPDLEDGYMFLLDAKVLSRDGQGVRQVIETLRKRGIYLTPAARERLAFWEA